jgi:hypothetical protein
LIKNSLQNPFVMKFLREIYFKNSLRKPFAMNFLIFGMRNFFLFYRFQLYLIIHKRNPKLYNQPVLLDCCCTRGTLSFLFWKYFLINLLDTLKRKDYTGYSLNKLISSCIIFYFILKYFFKFHYKSLLWLNFFWRKFEYIIEYFFKFHYKRLL